ncbi:DUF3363 domain-containing protein [Brevundimonas viscosa]|nr:DUF3363 domain-containing protein [Brevundimonas viscosa]
MRSFNRPTGSPGVRRFGSASSSWPRSVVVKLQVFGSAPTARRNLATHLSYIARSGAGTEGERVRLFNQDQDDLDRLSFFARCREDPRHYRLMIEPGDDSPLPDIRAFGRLFMAELERERGLRLEWAAADHHDTGRPHLHIVLRQRSLDGRRVSLGGPGAANRLRLKACELATDELGPLPERVLPELARVRSFTPADQVMLDHAVDERLNVSILPDHWRATVLRRLAYLEDRGLIAAGGPTEWAVPSDLRPRLLRAQLDQERAYRAARIVRDSVWRSEIGRLTPAALGLGERLVGGFVSVEGITPQRAGAHCAVIDGADGRLAHFEFRYAHSVMCLDRVPPGAVVEVSATARTTRRSDQRIAEIAAAHGGLWSVELHGRAAPSAHPRFIRMHQARLESMSLDGACRALGDGRFEIPTDYCERALRADLAKWGPADHQARVLDDRPLDEQIRAPGLTWLDRLMTNEERVRYAGPFGAHVAEALPEREKRLRMTGLGSGDPLVLSPADVRKLQAMELRSVMEPLEKTGRAVFLTKDGQQAAGQYVTRVHISGSPHAILEGQSAFHLVAWKPGMEAARGRWIEAVVREGRSEFRTVRNAMRQFGLG